ncbi:hypothetical protein, partial [Streptomyces sp. TRM49041]|uniref:hypothetical protein n=1 Tax=Streptomyces sp. TRM49041 TaxID=2603216 RepID=UPI0037DA13C5
MNTDAAPKRHARRPGEQHAPHHGSPRTPRHHERPRHRTHARHRRQRARSVSPAIGSQPGRSGRAAR